MKFTGPNWSELNGLISALGYLIQGVGVALGAFIAGRAGKDYFDIKAEKQRQERIKQYQKRFPKEKKGDGWDVVRIKPGHIFLRDHEHNYHYHIKNNTTISDMDWGYEIAEINRDELKKYPEGETLVTIEEK